MNEDAIIASYSIADDFINTVMNYPVGKAIMAAWAGKRGPKRRLSFAEVVTLNILPMGCLDCLEETPGIFCKEEVFQALIAGLFRHYVYSLIAYLLQPVTMSRKALLLLPRNPNPGDW